MISQGLNQGNQAIFFSSMMVLISINMPSWLVGLRDLFCGYENFAPSCAYVVDLQNH